MFVFAFKFTFICIFVFVFEFMFNLYNCTYMHIYICIYIYIYVCIHLLSECRVPHRVLQYQRNRRGSATTQAVAGKPGITERLRVRVEGLV